MNLLEPIKIGSKKTYLTPRTETEAVKNLESVVTQFAKLARWYPYMGKINRLRRALLELRLSRRTKP